MIGDVIIVSEFSRGGNSLNGTEYSLASDGCLVIYGVIYTHWDIEM
jgi:hypothetical protein